MHDERWATAPRRPMNFTLSDEQLELRSVVRRFLSERATESATRRLMASDTGYDPAVWAQLAGQLGLVGLAVPEEFGGAAAWLTEKFGGRATGVGTSDTAAVADVITRRGQNVNTVEQVLGQYPRVHEVAVAGAPPSEEELRDQVRAQPAGSKTPATR